MENKVYLDLLKREMPKTKEWPTLIQAFVAGGLVCMFGQLLGDLFKMWVPEAPKDDISAYVTLVLIGLTILFTALGVYDKVGAIAGAGLFIPITGFANAVSSSAIERNKEGIILGLCTRMFEVAGPIIVFGISSSVVVGIIALIFRGAFGG